jgi:predicted PurR-regulated permease PerM
MNSMPAPKTDGGHRGHSINQPQPGPDSTGGIDIEAVNARKLTMLNGAVLAGLFVAVLFVFIPMLKIFLTPLILALTFASLFFPLHGWLLKVFRGKRGVSALACCVVLVMGFVVPVYFVGYLVTHQLLTLYQQVEPTVQAFVRGESHGFFSRFDGNPVLAWLTRLDINWQSATIGTLKAAGAAIGKMVNRTSLGALEILVGLFMTLFIMFYLFMDGERIVKKFREFFPLRKTYQDMIISRFVLVSRATVKGTLVIASIQGTLGALILLIVGVKTWLLWGVVMVSLGFIPMMGAWMVLVPAGILQLATGNAWQGILVLTLSFGVVSTIDNVLRPRLVGQNARMHDLLIFFSTVGGLAMFGPVGAITGPVIMAFFVSITEISMKELKEHLGLRSFD